MTDPTPQTPASAERLDRLHRACRAVADNIAEFETVTDSELIDDLERALEGLAQPAPSLSESGDELARVVHRAWRDGMLAQGRKVALHRMAWETLSAEDHDLDRYIAGEVAAALTAAPAPAADAGLRAGVEALLRHWDDGNLVPSDMATMSEVDAVTEAIDTARALLAQHPTPPAGAGAEEQEALEARILRWMNTRDTGASSESIACAVIGQRPRHGILAPADSDDLGRCLRLIAQIPEARQGVEILAGQSRQWAALAPAWDELTAMGQEAGLLDRTAHWSPAINARLDQLRFPHRFPAQAQAEGGSR